MIKNHWLTTEQYLVVSVMKTLDSARGSISGHRFPGGHEMVIFRLIGSNHWAKPTRELHDWNPTLTDSEKMSCDNITCFLKGSQVSRIRRETHAFQSVDTLSRHTLYFSRSEGIHLSHYIYN